MDSPEELEFAWLMLIGISLTFLLALAVVVFFVYYQRRLHAQNLAMEQLKVEEQKKRLEATMAAQENERSRIARDLHDEVGVILSTVKLYMTFDPTKSVATNAPPAAKAELLLDEAVEKLRAIARNLSSEHLLQFGLLKALEAQCQQVEETGALEIDLDVHLKERLSPNLEMQLYRITQELLNNTLKHAQASRVNLTLRLEEQNLHVHYRDNGIGFDRSREGERNEGLGLNTIAGRVEVLNGSLALESASGKGMQATIRLPP